MPKRSPIDQLEQALRSTQESPRSRKADLDAETAVLVRIAAELQQLPSEDFKQHLKTDLQRRAMMATATETLTPKAVRNVATPYLAFKDAARAIDFYRRAFGATETMRLTEPSGKIGHAEMVIGDSLVMLSDEYPDYGTVSAETLGGSPVKIHLYVEDVDAVGQRAVAAGAILVRPIEDQFYGDRSGQLRDPFGYTWIVATRKEELSVDEVQRRLSALTAGEGKEVKEQQQSTNIKSIRQGFHTLTPYIMVHEAAELIEFAKRAFGAEELFRTIGSAGGIHAEVRIGDSMLMMGGGGQWQGPAMPTSLHTYVEDADAVYRRALEAGAVSVHKPTDQEYGDREATVKDLGGNYWYIATHKEGRAHVPEGLRTVTPYLHPSGVPGMMDFLGRAFGAEVVARHQSPDGTVVHAKVRIGDSMLELGEAHGPSQPMPTAFYMYVNDADAVYRQALLAGASSLHAPADQPYGDRMGGVQDPFGNHWFIATHREK